MHRALPFGPALALALAVAAPRPASAQIQRDDHLRLAAHFALGAGGDADIWADDRKSSFGLDPRIGFGVRAELPVHELVLVGALFEAATFQADISSLRDLDGRYWALDFDVHARVRYLVEIVRGEVFLEPYAMVPIGFSLGVFPDLSESSGETAWPGWNIGVMAGIGVVTSARIGGFLELGWRHHELYTELDLGLATSDIAFVANQLAMNLGVSYLLD